MVLVTAGSSLWIPFRPLPKIAQASTVGFEPVAQRIPWPRFWAMVISLTLLTIIGNGASLVTASVVGQIMMGVEQHTFWNGFAEMLSPMDFISGVIKAAGFGGMIALASCHSGLSTEGGAPGVGRAVNRAVVSSAVAIFFVDYFSTFVLG